MALPHPLVPAQVGFGSGFKCNSVVWRALRSVKTTHKVGPAASRGELVGTPRTSSSRASVHMPAARFSRWLLAHMTAVPHGSAGLGAHPWAGGAGDGHAAPHRSRDGGGAAAQAAKGGCSGRLDPRQRGAAVDRRSRNDTAYAEHIQRGNGVRRPSPRLLGLSPPQENGQENGNANGHSELAGKQSAYGADATVHVGAGRSLRNGKVIHAN